MNERSVVADRLRRKMQEVQTLEEKLKAAKIYVHALQDVMKALGGVTPGPDSKSERILRTGSAVSLARGAILMAGKAVHISDLIVSMGKEDTRENRASLNSSLSAYVRRGEIFTRPAPNTYGLVELGHEGVDVPGISPPDEFGGAPSEEDDDEITF